MPPAKNDGRAAGGQIVLKDCRRHGRRHTGLLCPQCIVSCIGGDDVQTRVPHEWQKDDACRSDRVQKLTCAKCGAGVSVSHGLLGIAGLPHNAVMRETLQGCCPCSDHDIWDVWEHTTASSRCGACTATCASD